MTSDGDETKQKLKFKLAGTPTAPVEWWLNGQKLATNSSDDFTCWYMDIGSQKW
ncbi:hypothetical protein [Brasilonema sp. UFV-L1]|uniref:hypothetical protein n=1 Tax=Brasilonema sp. UFV-L1 TaxID=2234130 RepID=UPI0030DC395F